MDCILTVNVGSSSLKFAIFQANKKLAEIHSGQFDGKSAELFNWIKHHYPEINIKIIGHRIVHGGKDFLHPTLITDKVLAQLKKLIHLAPLHMPPEIDFIEMVQRSFPDMKQVACFDTAFHRTQSRLATLFAIPRKYADQDGIIRYGFHGLSYEYIAHKLKKKSRLIVAHLGNGASLCAIRNGKSIATSMGFSALDGLVMGTRCGNIDPGVLLYLLSQKGMTLKELENMLYKESGLLGVSGITSDVRELIASNNPNAKEALDLFCYRAVREIASLAGALKGVDILIFTGGIGENSDYIRDKICSPLEWMGLEIDKVKNKSNSTIISTKQSKIEVYVIPTNEELLIAKYSLAFIK